MEETNARTLGEYFAGLDPEDRESRIRKAWTARKMYLDEFEAIWAAQSPHHPALTDEWKKADSRRHLSSTAAEIAKAPDRDV